MINEMVPVKTFKCKPGLGKLNRLTKLGQTAVVANGHAKRSFKRNYTDGTATYTCPHCSSTAVVTLSSGRGKSVLQGEALALHCSVQNS